MLARPDRHFSLCRKSTDAPLVQIQVEYEVAIRDAQRKIARDIARDWANEALDDDEDAVLCGPLRAFLTAAVLCVGLECNI